MQRSHHHTPHGRRDPKPTLSEKLPTSPAGFVLLLSFQEQAPQARGSAQKTPQNLALHSARFSNNGLGAGSSWESGSRKAGQDWRGTIQGLKMLGGMALMCAHLKGACSACMRRAPGPELQGASQDSKEPEAATKTPTRSQLKAMPEENPTPGTTSSGDASSAPHSSNQTDHPNHSPRGTSRYTPGYRCPFPLSPRHRLPRESPLHPGPGSL